MKTVIALLAVLALAAVSVSVEGNVTSETWVSNQSTKNIRATTEHDFDGKSGFQNRLITPQTAQSDTYSWSNCNGAGTGSPVGVTLGLDGSRHPQQTTWISCDQSVVALDNPDGLSADIYDSVDGEINTPTGGKLMSISP